MRHSGRRERGWRLWTAAGAVVVLAMLGSSAALAERARLNSDRTLTADQRGTEAAPLVVKGFPATQSPQEAAEERKDRDEQLANDRNLVKLTGWLAGIGFLQLIVFGAQAIMLLVTVRGSRTAIEAAQRSAEAAEQAVANSNALLVLSRETSERDLRAWVSIDLDLAGCHRGADFAFVDVCVRIKNIGKTPALRVAVSVRCSCVPSVTLNNGSLPTPKKHPPQMPSLMPGAEANQKIGERIVKRDLEKGVAEARRVDCAPMIVIDAIVCYHTIFDPEDAPKRMTSIRYQMHPNISDTNAAEARRAWLDKDGPAAPDQVLFAHNKSAPAYLT